MSDTANASTAMSLFDGTAMGAVAAIASMSMLLMQQVVNF